jgi:hypothetical protein
VDTLSRASRVFLGELWSSFPFHEAPVAANAKQQGGATRRGGSLAWGTHLGEKSQEDCADEGGWKRAGKMASSVLLMAYKRPSYVLGLIMHYVTHGCAQWCRAGSMETPGDRSALVGSHTSNASKTVSTPKTSPTSSLAAAAEEGLAGGSRKARTGKSGILSKLGGFVRQSLKVGPRVAL